MPDDVENVAARHWPTAVERLDLLTATLDGLRQQLLGLDPDTLTDGTTRTKAAGRHLRPARAGRVRRCRWRRAPCGSSRPACSTRSAAPWTCPPWHRRSSRSATRSRGRPGALRLRPRLPRPARWMFRLVDAGGGVEPLEAAIDQVDPSGTVNPVAGFLLPDHLDESLEVFDAQGQPVGELFHDRDRRPSRLGDRPRAHRPARRRPAVRPDRRGSCRSAGSPTACSPPTSRTAPARRRRPSPRCSAALRAIDTTLWTVDTFANLGSEHVAGLVGRPLAVVRAQLWLELQPEDGLDLSDPRPGRGAQRPPRSRWPPRRSRCASASSPAPTTD